jgi:ABC-type multidrug transport system fused ATPase/permease subunit
MASFVYGLLRPYRRLVAIVFAAMLAETVMSLAAPWPLKIVIDNVIGSHGLPAWLAQIVGPETADHKLRIAATAAIALVAIAAIGGVAGYVESYYSESVGQWIANDLRLKVYEHLERLSLSYYDKHETGQLLSTLTDDIGAIQSFASSSTLGIVVDIMTIVGMIGLMFWLDWNFALITMAVTPFLLFAVTRFKAVVKAATHDVRRKQSTILTVLQQGLQSIRVVEAFGREDLERERLADASAAGVAAALSARRVKSLLAPLIAIVVALCTAIVLWRGASLILKGAMTIGSLTVFLAYLQKFFKPVQDLAKMTNAIAQTGVGIDRVRSLLDIDAVIPEPAVPVPLDRAKGAVTFEDVTFEYDVGRPVLRGVSFTVKPGQTVGIVGATGGGKSTIMNLLPRFYDPSSGRVLVDDVDVRGYALADLRKQIGFVLQDTVLFWGTIAENIAYGRQGATDADVIEAATIANAHGFISAMPLGYATPVGERGLTLSGGQRQRIGIARAVIRNAPILLLDEPTAALDTESERLVIEALQRLMQGRTVITIAHRLGTIRDVDVIVVLQDGIVAEHGTHEELLALGGSYALLEQAQRDPKMKASGG